MPSNRPLNPTVAGFQWDQGNREKCQKHGVSLAEIEQLFDRTIAVFPDPIHSGTEERLKAIGQTASGRHVLIVFALRETGQHRLIRPISARYMHAKEVAHYEKATAHPDHRHRS